MCIRDRLNNVGALVTFTGIVRGKKSETLDYMFIEHYPGMTENQIKSMINDAVKRWNISDALVIHRYGKLEPGEPIMMVATAAEHRKEASNASLRCSAAVATIIMGSPGSSFP